MLTLWFRFSRYMRAVRRGSVTVGRRARWQRNAALKRPIRARPGAQAVRDTAVVVDDVVVMMVMVVRRSMNVGSLARMSVVLMRWMPLDGMRHVSRPLHLPLVFALVVLPLAVLTTFLLFYGTLTFPTLAFPALPVLAISLLLGKLLHVLPLALSFHEDHVLFHRMPHCFRASTFRQP